tara:strand:- start:196 stop:768 length:573 start_codon:yes stop_codon:yes gene_type:complete
MIGRISGILLEKNPLLVLIDCDGLGYEVNIPMSTFYKLPAIGEKIVLIIHFHVRDDSQQLFGFNSINEREIFRDLIKISGVGARTALSLLSGLSIDNIASAVINQEIDMLVKIPGIGKKTAERLLLELKGKVNMIGDSDFHRISGINEDILKALITLGYSEKEARQSIEKLPKDISISDGIRSALNDLSK